MTKFASIWGELTVGNVSPVEEKIPPVPPVDDKTGKPEDVLENTEDDDAATAAKVLADKEAADAAAAEKAKAGGGDAGDDADDYEFDETDVNKAFTMLADEGVIEIDEEADYDATPAGFADVVAETIRKGIQKEISATPQAVQQLYAHVMNGGDPKEFEFSEELSWNDVDEDDEAMQRAGLHKLYLGQGMTPEEATEEIEDIPADKLAKKGSIAISTLAKQETADKAAKAAADAEAEDAAKLARDKEVSDIEALIDESDEMAGFKLDEARRKAFKKYLFKPAARTGKTQLQSNMADEKRKLRIAFLDFIDYNKKDVEKAIEDDLTKKRRKKLTRFTGKNAANVNSSQSVKSGGSKNQGSIVFPSIFGNQEIEVED